MTDTNPYARFAPLMILLVMALGAVNWYFAPEFSTKWAVSIFFLPVAWSGLQIAKMAGACAKADDGSAREILRGITGAGFILAVSLALSLAQTQTKLTEVWADRLTGLLLGGVLIVMGNYLPKRLKPLKAGGCSQASQQAMQRFAGWTFVLGGIAFSAAWLFLPLEYSHSVAISAGVISVLLVMTRWFWLSYRTGHN